MSLKKLKRKIFSRPRLARILILSGVLILLVLFLHFLLFPLVPKVFTSRPFSLPQNNGRTNILFMGVGGAKHEGSDLTDTIIVASVATKFNDGLAVALPIILISIPRDIYLDSISDKINAAYSLGKERRAGLALPKELVSEITGLPIHFAVVIDFSVFEKTIDLLGGVDINVPNTFDDYQYPIDGKENDFCNGDLTFACRYEHLHFDAGLQHMNGKTALKFVRSRYAQGVENSDFARSRRQQLVLEAIRTKVFSLPNFLNISVGLQIYNDLKTNIDTDFDFSDPNGLLKLALNYRNIQFKNLVLDENQLVNPPQDYRGWILLPIGGNWDQVHQFIATKSGQILP